MVGKDTKSMQIYVSPSEKEVIEKVWKHVGAKSRGDWLYNLVAQAVQDAGFDWPGDRAGWGGPRNPESED